MRRECEAVQKMTEECGTQYDEILEVLKACRGKIVFMGVGKSGHIGKKLAATFASTGTPSIFVHGTEACHGDFGMILREDVAVLISNSGKTAEVVQDLAGLKAIGCKTVAFTSDPDSPLAQGCAYRLIYRWRKPITSIWLRRYPAR